MQYLQGFCVDFIPLYHKQLVDSLEQNICCNKTSFHPTNSWTSSGLRENLNSAPYLCSSRKVQLWVPVSPIVANLYMKYCHPPPRMWLRFVDDTSVIQKKKHIQNFLEHINTVDHTIKCKEEDNKDDGAIPFLDTIVKPEADGRLSITVYKKPTHRYQYLQRDSHHHLYAKYSVINTLIHRAKQYVINLSFSRKKWNISGRHSLTVSTPNGP